MPCAKVKMHCKMKSAVWIVGYELDVKIIKKKINEMFIPKSFTSISKNNYIAFLLIIEGIT